jgi:hypothetical protein
MGFTYLPMGRKKRPPTTVLRVPLEHKQKVLDYIQYLKQSEVGEQVEPVEQPEQPEPAENPVFFGLVQEIGIVDLHKIAQFFGINYLDEHGRMLEKERLRQKVMRFFYGLREKSVNLK